MKRERAPATAAGATSKIPVLTCLGDIVLAVNVSRRRLVLRLGWHSLSAKNSVSCAFSPPLKLAQVTQIGACSRMVVGFPRCLSLGRFFSDADTFATMRKPFLVLVVGLVSKQSRGVGVEPTMSIAKARLVTRTGHARTELHCDCKSKFRTRSDIAECRVKSIRRAFPERN